MTNFNLKKFLELVAPGYDIKKEENKMSVKQLEKTYFSEFVRDGRKVIVPIKDEEIFKNNSGGVARIFTGKKGYLIADILVEGKADDRPSNWYVKDKVGFLQVKMSESFVNSKNNKSAVVMKIRNSKTGKYFYKVYTEIYKK